MPYRLVFVLLLLIFEGAFIGFNLENACDVWLFKSFEAVPVYITVLVSFAAGALLFMLIFAFGRKRRRKTLRQEGEERGALYEGKKQRFGERKAKSARGQGAQSGAPSFGNPLHTEASRPNAPESPAANSSGNPEGES